MYDSNSDGTVDTTYAACETLPPPSDATPLAFDDAGDWGCQKFSSLTAPARVAPPSATSASAARGRSRSSGTRSAELAAGRDPRRSRVDVTVRDALLCRGPPIDHGHRPGLDDRSRPT